MNNWILIKTRNLLAHSLASSSFRPQNHSRLHEKKKFCWTAKLSDELRHISGSSSSSPSSSSQSENFFSAFFSFYWPTKLIKIFSRFHLRPVLPLNPHRALSSRKTPFFPTPNPFFSVLLVLLVWSPRHSQRTIQFDDAVEHIKVCVRTLLMTK